MAWNWAVGWEEKNAVRGNAFLDQCGLVEVEKDHEDRSRQRKAIAQVRRVMLATGFQDDGAETLGDAVGNFVWKIIYETKGVTGNRVEVAGTVEEAKSSSVSCRFVKEIGNISDASHHLLHHCALPMHVINDPFNQNLSFCLIIFAE